MDNIERHLITEKFFLHPPKQNNPSVTLMISVRENIHTVNARQLFIVALIKKSRQQVENEMRKKKCYSISAIKKRKAEAVMRTKQPSNAAPTIKLLKLCLSYSTNN